MQTVGTTGLDEARVPGIQQHARLVLMRNRHDLLRQVRERIRCHARFSQLDQAQSGRKLPTKFFQELPFTDI